MVTNVSAHNIRAAVPSGMFVTLPDYMMFPRIIIPSLSGS
jgi:hypothetical protein